MVDDNKYLSELTEILTMQDSDELYVARDQGTDPDRDDLRIQFVNFKAEVAGAGALDDLSDVVLTAPSINQVLAFGGADWLNVTLPPGNLLSLTDTNITGEVPGEILVFDSSSPGDWVNQTLAESGISAVGHTHLEADITNLQAYLLDITSESLGSLSDVLITVIGVGEILSWGGVSWFNQTHAEAGISAVGHTHLEADITNLQAYLLDITGESIGDLSDVVLAGMAQNDVMAYSGSQWENTPFPIGGLSDVVITGALKGDLIAFNGSNWVDLAVGANDDVLTADSAEATGLKWATPSGGSPHALDSHTDVVVTAAADNEVLAFHNATGDWINQTPAEAGLSAVGHTHLEADITNLQAYLLAELNDLTAAVVWANIPDANVPETAVTQHEAAMAVLWSQITGNPTEYPVAVSRNSAAAVGQRATLNFIEGTNVTLVVADDGPGDEIDITINAAGGTELNDLTAAVVWASIPDVNVPETAVTQHEAALAILWSQVTGAPAFLEDITGESLNDLSDVAISLPADNEVLGFNFGTSKWVNQTALEAGLSEAGHTHLEVDITNLQAYLLDITAEVIGDLSGVVVTAFAKGDIMAHNGSNLVDLTVGSNTQVLTADSAEATGMKWATPSSGSAKGESKYVARMQPDINSVVLSWYTGNVSTPGEDAEELLYIDADTTYWMGRFINRNYGGGGQTVEFWVRADGASGNGFWGAAIHRIGDDIEDADTAHTWVWTDLADAVPSVVGEYARVTISMTDGANIDSLADNEMYTLIVRRQGDHATDTADGVELFTTRPIVYET